jgi:uncharacterized repeat protein (TIGR03803 family)
MSSFITTVGKHAILILALFASAASGHAQTFTVLNSFTATQGPYARAGLIQGIDGNLYGAEGGGHFVATVLKITPAGTMTTVSTFPVPDANFTSALVQAMNGSLYGVTPGVEYSTNLGQVYQITPAGVATVIAEPCCADWATEYPAGELIQAVNGEFYGITPGGGTYDQGTFFEMTPEGVVTILYSFCGENCDQSGWDPTGGLVQGTDGNFYGVTYGGGHNLNTGTGYGTVFKVTTSGTYTTLYRFCRATDCPDGDNPTSLLQGTDGNFYGTTISGGAQTFAGTVFKLTPNGTLTTLHSFCSASNASQCTDGNQPQPGLIQASDGNFYGTTSEGGSGQYCAFNGCGTIFQITPSGAFTTLYSFCSETNCDDGSEPAVGLVQATNGDFYGVTNEGGTDGYGAVFRLSMGLPPFVKTLPVAAPAGATIEVMGTDLKGASQVTFNGAVAAFHVVSSSLIVAQVPAGATTGTLQVVTPNGALSSNVPFRVP